MGNVNSQIHSLFLRVGEGVFQIELRFRGAGTFITQPPPTEFESGQQLVLGTIVTDKGDEIWTGAIKLSLSGFELVIDVNNDEHFPWHELPEALSIFDGGYAHLKDETWSTAFEDILRFAERCKVATHWRLDGKNFRTPFTLPRQEALKNVSEVLLESSAASSLEFPAGTVCVLELELFEQSYFIVSVLEEREDTQFAFRLTEYCYQSKRRAGERIPTSAQFPIGLVTEVSDFGIRLETSEPIARDTVCLRLSDVDVLFAKVFSERISDDRYIHGLRLVEDSEKIRKVWQTFLLPYQYPSLCYRQEPHHEKFWELYYKTGYMEFSYTKYLEVAKEHVLNTWRLIDDAGPAVGGSVFASESDVLVSSIGVAKLGGGICVAQAANTLAEPKYLPHTRNMYSWRTRFMLQQPDTTFHLAFLHRDKKFLDRFFRSFYLKENSSEILWDEWNLFVLKNAKPSNTSTPLRPKSQMKAVEFQTGGTFLDKIGKIQNGNFELSTVAGGHVLESVPHLHMMQYLTGVWSEIADVSPDNLFPKQHVFFSYYTRLETEAARTALSRFRDESEIIHEGWHVTWMCPKPLLPSFLSNSLRALEVMSRKYPAGRAA